MSTSDIVCLLAILGGYLGFVLLLSVLDEHRLERRR